MAGEPSLFLVYKDFTTAERNSATHGMRLRLSADDAATDGGTGFTAHQGALKVPEELGDGLDLQPDR